MPPTGPEIVSTAPLAAATGPPATASVTGALIAAEALAVIGPATVSVFVPPTV